MKSIRLATLIFFIGSCNAQPSKVSLQTNKDNNTLLWEISGKGLAAPSYLFGTFHLLCKSDIHFSQPVQQAVQSVNELYLEMDLDDPNTLLGAMSLMNMNGAKQLKDLYSPDEYTRLSNFFKDSLRSSLTPFQSMKPAFLESMLYPKMMPCKYISGVEEELMVLAKKDKKKIQGLETMAFQASVFDSIPYAEQAKELLKTIDSIASYRLYFDTLITVYKSQQLGEIEKMFGRAEFGMQDNQDILLNKRNKNWVAQLKTIMKKESVFIAVGAGHLVGDMGLIALLRKEGYLLRPILNL
jgi:uncharacterized protein YbaP (TraB family)